MVEAGLSAARFFPKKATKARFGAVRLPLPASSPSKDWGKGYGLVYGRVGPGRRAALALTNGPQTTGKKFGACPSVCPSCISTYLVYLGGG